MTYDYLVKQISKIENYNKKAITKPEYHRRIQAIIDLLLWEILKERGKRFWKSIV